jgi:hypothetical protein
MNLHITADDKNKTITTHSQLTLPFLAQNFIFGFSIVS